MEAGVARTAVHLVIDEGLTVAATARALNDRALFARSGRPWSAANLHRRLTSSSLLDGEVVFRNPVGAGKGGAKVGPDGTPLYGASVTIVVPRIITEERAAALVRALAANGHAAHAEAGDYPLTGRIQGACGHHYVGAYRAYPKSNGTRYYRCSGGNNGKGASTGCDDPYLAAAGIEAAVREEVAQTLADAGLIAAIEKRKPRLLPGSEARQRERVAGFERTLHEREAAIARAAKDLSRVEGLAQDVRDAVLRQLDEDVLRATRMLATAREVLAEYEAAATAARTDREALALAAGGGAMSLAQLQRVFELLEVRARPLERVRQRTGVGCKVTDWHLQTGVLVPDDVTEARWEVVEEAMAAFFPRRQFVRGSVDIRTQLNGILHRLRTGCLWDELPARYGPHGQIKDRQNSWFKRGFWPPLMDVLNARGGGSEARREESVPALEVVYEIKSAGCNRPKDLHD
ncbi:transposase [Streptomyces sp. NPDC006552]|uniref:transposase n=1 Tax=Streptomyces sp. NPDC006552 TaxID=3157179 RepID=UPI0033BE8F84